MALPVEATSKLDVLFVVDNEDSTLEHEIALVDAFPALLGQISIDGRPDLHLGTVSPDLGVSTANGVQGPRVGTGPGACHDAGDGGALHQYRTTITDRFLIDNAEATNHPGALADDTEAILDFGGGSGCGFQQHLSAARAAFTNPVNVGFRRPDAALGIVVLSDEDDCSVLDPQVFGPSSPTLGALSHFRCTQFGLTCDQLDMTSVGLRTNCKPDAASTEIEDPADFIDVFRAQASDPRRVAFGAICNADLTEAATKIGIGLRRAMGDPCVEDNVPLDPCTAVDELDGVETRVPPCGASSASCWELVTDETTCPNAAHQKLVVHRIGSAPAGTYTLLRC